MQVFRRMQTLVGLICWFAEKKTRSPVPGSCWRSRRGCRGRCKGRWYRREPARPGGVEAAAGSDLVRDRTEGRIAEPAEREFEAWHVSHAQIYRYSSLVSADKLWSLLKGFGAGRRVENGPYDRLELSTVSQRLMY